MYVWWINSCKIADIQLINLSIYPIEYSYKDLKGGKTRCLLFGDILEDDHLFYFPLKALILLKDQDRGR